ncbi:MAG: gliding motility-associated C-terminal domain-containing protein [Bacteroidota bacterium]
MLTITPRTLSKACLLVFWSLCAILRLHGQELLVNPSFEGNPEPSQTPAGWIACNEFGTPDIQPGAWNVNEDPSDGNTYISLLARGVETSQGVSTEGIGQFLEADLQPGKGYYFRIDVAQSAHFGLQSGPHDLGFDAPVRLRVWLGNDPCDPLLLAGESELVQHIEWKPYHFYFSNEYNQPFSFLFLEVVHADPDDPRSGNIILDNASLTPAGELERCSWYIPNVFSPNGDGNNDFFGAFGACEPFDFQLLVFDRWGNLVFSGNHPDLQWDGSNVRRAQAEGVYFWRLSYQEMTNGFPKPRLITGSLTLIR